MKRNEFEIIELGTTYEIPKYTIVPNEGLKLLRDVIDEKDLEVLPKEVCFQELTFVRGDKRAVSKEEYEEAVKEVNRLAPYLSKESFFEETNTFKSTGVKYALALAKSTIAEYEKSYSESYDIIKRYINPIPKVDGITHEQLLGLIITDLTYKSQLVPSRETSIAITKLTEALMWLEERQRNRESSNTQGTYKTLNNKMNFEEFIELITENKSVSVPAIPFYYLNKDNGVVSLSGRLMYKTPDSKGMPFYCYFTMKSKESKDRLFVIRGYIEGESFTVDEETLSTT